VFAAVLIGRISIEMGNERAALFALPLGAAVFVVLLRFVEHPSPLSPLINLLLIGLVWWSAHKLTWDCTLIDDNQDASGEGLLQRIGVDAEEITTADRGSVGNELINDTPTTTSPWWQRFVGTTAGPHTPGLWVLYFSIAALPLFGVGQWWIPAASVARRQYAFSLLVVYVAAGLALLVTTSFLGLRRYLRQRRVEMPDPMAATWIAIGALLIGLVMFAAALVPRPHAEYAISQVPWKVGSPDGLQASKRSVGRDAANEQTDEQSEPGDVVSDNENAPTGDAADNRSHDESADGQDGQRTSNGQQQGDHNQQHQSGDQSSDSATSQSDAGQSNEHSDGQTGESQNSESAESSDGGDSTQSGDQSSDETSGDSQSSDDANRSGSSDGNRTSRFLPEHKNQFDPVETLQNLPNLAGGLAGLLKAIFYLVAGGAVLYLMWKHRGQLLAALVELIQSLRELLAKLFGRQVTAVAGDDQVESAASRPSRRPFSEFRDPFASGDARRIPAAELVRYTFEAFEAWSAERGHPRTPDQTPHELVRAAVEPSTTMYTEAGRLVRAYNELAYAGGKVSSESADQLRTLWQLMRQQ
jgi:hypothetical protein